MSYQETIWNLEQQIKYSDEAETATKREMEFHNAELDKLRANLRRLFARKFELISAITVLKNEVERNSIYESPKKEKKNERKG